MLVEWKRTIDVLVYWGILSLLVGWIAHQSEPIELIGLAILYSLGFCAAVFCLEARSIKNEEVKT